MEAVKTYDTPLSCVRCHANVGHWE
jgi:hypothetical protein